MRHAFSLVELSIVLVILGLITGGILGGQSLIRAAELRSVTADVQRYTTAVYSFRDKYFQLPGDMSNATKFWGEQHATPATCQTTASSSALTCDGNGDGLIMDATYEMFRAWQHLANAGLIEGQYNGVVGPGSIWHHQIGINSPRGRIPNTGWGISWLGNFVGDNSTYAMNYGNLFWFGVVGSMQHRPQQSAMTPEEMWNLDTKTDDGLPARGSVIMRSDNTWGATNCSTSTGISDFTGVYNLSYRSKVCAAMIQLR